MRIVILSDTHCMVNDAIERLRLLKPDVLIHLGDHTADAEQIHAAVPGIPMYCVKGNCDPYSKEPAERVLEFAGHRIFAVHGHRFGVKDGLLRLYYAGLEHRADIILYGHTHVADVAEKDGVLVLNPGSSGNGGTLAVLRLEEGEREATILRL